MADLRNWGAMAMLALWTGASASCSTQTSGDAAKPSDAVERVLAACSAETGYDPDAAASLPPDQLGPNEQEWGHCVYKGVERHVLPNSAAPDLYRKLIARHRELTAAIEAKQMTRDGRRRELIPLLDEIRAAENSAAAEREKQIRDVQDILEQQRMIADLERTERSAVRAEQAVRVRLR
jgi:hypothetical protein